MLRKEELINAIKEYLKDLINQHKEFVEITEFNVDIQHMIENLYSTNGWTPVDEGVPTDDRYILISFANFSVPIIGKYEEDENGGNFFAGDEDISLLSQGMIVNAWMELPKRYED